MLNYLTFIRTGRVSIPKTADVYGVPTLPLGIVSIVTVAAGYAVIRTPDPSLVVFRNSLSMPRPGNQAYGAEHPFLSSNAETVSPRVSEAIPNFVSKDRFY